MKFLLPLLLVFGLSLAEVKIKEKHIQVNSDSSLTDAIKSDNYPDSAKIEERQIWHLSSAQGAKILLTCNDLRISPSTDCEKGFLEVINGDSKRRHCGSESGLTVLSNGNKMTVIFELIWASGLTVCSVSGVADDKSQPNVPDPSPLPGNDESIYLKLGSDAYDKINFEVPSNYKRKWSFSTDKENKISAVCEKMNFLSDKSCRVDKASFNGQNVCGLHYNYIFKSEGNTLNIEIVSSRNPGDFKCLIQAINGPSPFQYKNLPSEEVYSGENGLGGGVKDTNCKCGWSKKQSNRILNGKNAREGQYPWMVSLSLDGSGCGGSILTQRHILTAAHCTAGRDVRKCSIGYGSNDLSKVRRIDVERIIDHQYDKQNFHLNDISILLLKQKLEFSENVGPICLTRESPKINHQYVTAMGWGWLGGNDGFPGIMQHTNLRVVDFPTCNSLWYWRFSEYDRICALASNRTACSGDSGSSVVYVDPETNRYTQLGVKSFAAGCNTNKPLVNSYVPYFYDWIQKVISDTDPSMVTCSKRG